MESVYTFYQIKLACYFIFISEANEGNFFPSCNSLIYVSKAMVQNTKPNLSHIIGKLLVQFSQTAARKLCCAKNMQLIAIEDNAKKLCVGRELQSMFV
jgi:hypothetical protein